MSAYFPEQFLIAISENERVQFCKPKAKTMYTGLFTY